MRIALLLLLNGAVLASDESPAWSTFSPSTQAYKVLLPGTPKEETVVQNAQEVAVVTAEGELPSGLFFVIMTMEIPEKGTIKRREDAERFLDGAVAGYRERPGMQILETSEIMLGSIPGRQIIADGFQGNKVRARHYAVGTRSYCLMAQSGDLESLHSDKAAKFFDSFELLNLPPEPLNEHGSAYELGRKVGAAFMSLAVVTAFIAVVAYLLRPKNRSKT
jgi:hypothetical protein